MQKISSARNRRAFTLIEVMVAAAITIVMVGLVIQITGEVLKLWNRSMGKLSANAEARMAMELLTSDLEMAVLVNNGQQWLRVETNVTDSPIVGQTVALKLFTTAMDRQANQAGNISAVSYRLAEAPAYDGAKEDSFVLFRALEEPRETFDTLLGSTADGSKQQELMGGFWDETNTVNPANYLAGNIVDFKVYLYGDVIPSGETQKVEVIFNASGDVEVEGDDLSYTRSDDFDGSVSQNYVYGGIDSSQLLPTFAEISLTIMSDEGLEILRLLSQGIEGTGFENSQEGVNDVILQHGEVFKRRVHFKAKPF
ncbi:MAG: type II secretion system protein J [Opitutales bacterium]